jgi:2-oxoisovalerate dehydrogenase E1 component alpha subunit
MRKRVVAFDIWSTSFLGIDGQPVDTEPAPPLPETADLVLLYRAMVRTRTFDAKAVALQRTGRIGTFASSLGQEAVAVGVAAAMRADDVLVPSFREQGAQLWRGVAPVELLAYWGGDERGSDFAAARHDFPICVPVGTHAAHATGVALAFQLRHERRVAVCVFGDGATSRGDVYESMNYAGVRNLPVVFVVNNNQWAISVPRSQQTHAETLAQKAIGVGIRGEQVDGNDVVAVRAVVGDAVELARAGGGPSLVEAVTYRLSDHTTADDAGRYRSDAEVSERWAADPVSRLRAYLAADGHWGRVEEEALLAECAAELDAAVDAYEALAPRDPSSMFDHLYATLPDAYRAQAEEVGHG